MALAAGEAASPTAYIVRLEDLRPLRELPSSFIDRGRKHHAVSLARLLVGQPRIPFIVGDYKLPGKLVQSLRTLLEKAAQRRESNSYLVGVTNSLFAAVKAQARASSAPVSPRARPFTARYLDQLGPISIPESLSTKLVGASPELDLVRELIVRASAHTEPVLILGDTGSGKEVAARAIHDLGEERRRHNFVAVNCGAIPSELFEAELFGYGPGAFTGALRRGKRGLWTVAQDGTLFLDEIGDLSPRHQVKILRALEDGKIRPVGGLEDITVQCRVIAATNHDVYSMVQSGAFREDLYYRLRSCLIRMPRLCDHPQDIPLLAQYFWRKLVPARPMLSEEVLSALTRYRWPGNTRELRAVLVR